MKERRLLDRYFFEEKNPFTSKPVFNTRNIKLLGGVILGLCVALVVGASFYENSDTKKAVDRVVEAAKSTPPENPMSPQGGIGVGGSGFGSSSTNQAGSLYGSRGGRSYGGGTKREMSASQIVKGTDGVSGSGLPLGSTISARLSNALISSDGNQPVIAEITEDAVWQNTVLIPAGARAIGTASFDDTSKRLQIRFQNLVYPDGDQHGLQALALLGDGSSGLTGTLHSGNTRKQVGRFLGNLVGGLAEGLKQRQASGGLGIAFEPGSIRNGVLNGISTSASDQAQALSQESDSTKPYLEVSSGTAFLIYLEKEYAP